MADSSHTTYIDGILIIRIQDLLVFLLLYSAAMLVLTLGVVAAAATTGRRDQTGDSGILPTRLTRSHRRRINTGIVHKTVRDESSVSDTVGMPADEPGITDTIDLTKVK